MLADLAALTGWTPKAGSVWGGGYAPLQSGSANWGMAGGAQTARHFLSRNNLSRIWSPGTLSAVELRVEQKPAAVTAFYVAVWRQNAAGTWDRVGQENIWSALTAGATAKVAVTPITVQRGDFVGYGIEAAPGTTSHLRALTGQADGSTRFVNEAPAETAYNWMGGTASPNLYPIRCYVSPSPSAVCIGDSLIAGHPGNYSEAEDSLTRSAASDVADYLRSMLGTSMPNLGRSGETTAAVAARISNAVVPLAPRWALINGGVNDLIAETPQATFLGSWAAILDACEAAGIVPFVLPILPWTNGTADQHRVRDAWNAALAALVGSYPQAVYASDALIMLGQSRSGGDAGNLWDIRPAYDADGIHLTAAGYSRLAQAVVRAITQHGVRSTQAALPDSAAVQAAASDALEAVGLDGVAEGVEAIQSKTALINAAAITVTSPITPSGNITVYRTADYDADEGRSIDLYEPVEDAPWLAEATVQMRTTQATWGGTLEQVTYEGAACWRMRFEYTAEMTSALTPGIHEYQVWAVLENGREVERRRGSLTVKRDIPAVTQT